MNFLYFDGGPLSGQNFSTPAPAGQTFESNGGRYRREESWRFDKDRVINCYRYVGPSGASGAGKVP